MPKSISAPSFDKEDLQGSLKTLQSKRSDVQGFAAAVLLPDGTMVSAATGEADPEGRPMTADTPVRTASITKTLVAASILRLWEDKLINLDAPIHSFISTRHIEILNNDGYDPYAITIRDLLMHTSGLNDHFVSNAFQRLVMADPTKVWTRTAQLEVLTEHLDPVGRPGLSYAYSDSGYILLGEVIETITDETLCNAVRRVTRLNNLDLAATWWDWMEAPSSHAPDRAHQWLGERDTYTIHGSVDAFGGGGLVGSVEDVAKIYSALFGGLVFDKPETLEIMMAAPGFPKGSPYRMGLFYRPLDQYAAYGHAGYWGTDVFTIPDLGITVSGVALNATGLDDLRTWEVELLRRYFI